MGKYINCFTVSIDECSISDFNDNHVESLEKEVYNKFDNQYFEISVDNPLELPNYFISSELSKMLDNKVREDFLNVYIKYSYQDYKTINLEDNSEIVNDSKLSYEYSNK